MIKKTSGDPSEILLQMKKELTAKNSEVSTLKGRISEKYEQLKARFGCGDFETGEKKLETIKLNLVEKEKSLFEGVEQLKTKYKWSFAEGEKILNESI